MNYRPRDFQSPALPSELSFLMVDKDGIEPSTSELSAPRSNQLSYSSMWCAWTDSNRHGLTAKGFSYHTMLPWPPKRCSLDFLFTMRFTFRCAPSSLYTFLNEASLGIVPEGVSPNLTRFTWEFPTQVLLFNIFGFVGICKIMTIWTP